jgi:hypothetical protein
MPALEHQGIGYFVLDPTLHPECFSYCFNLGLRIRLVFEFPLAFIKFYFFRRHVTGGLAGFQMAMFGAISRFVRIVRMLELAEKARASGPDTPSAK